MLIRIVFVIFIANGIDCLGKDCDNCCDCCDCLKKKDENEDKDENEEIEEYEEIKEDENNTAKSLVNIGWYESKKENLVLKIFKKKENKAFQSKENGDKILIKFGKDNNPKIDYQNEAKDGAKLEYEKYAFCEIKTNTNKTVYLYCSDVESSGNEYGMFSSKDHKSISIIACDTTNVENMGIMFSKCSSLEKLDIKNFNTTNVTDMACMFYECKNLTKLDLENFDTTKVKDMTGMFADCSSLTNLKFGQNFNTTNVTNMSYMFNMCSSLEKLDIKNFNTTNVTNMNYMFFGCSNLKELESGENFNTEKNPDVEGMFDGCSLPQKTQDEILGKNK